MGLLDLASRHFLYSEGRENLTSQRVGYEFTYRLPPKLLSERTSKGNGGHRRYQVTVAPVRPPSDSPCMNNLNGRPVSLHVRGGERSGDNTRVRRRATMVWPLWVGRHPGGPLPFGGPLPGGLPHKGSRRGRPCAPQGMLGPLDSSSVISGSAGSSLPSLPL